MEKKFGTLNQFASAVLKQIIMCMADVKDLVLRWGGSELDRRFFLAQAIAEEGDFLTLKDEIEKKDLKSMCKTLAELLGGEICVEIIDNSKVLAVANPTSQSGVKISREGGGWRLEPNNLATSNLILRRYRTADNTPSTTSRLPPAIVTMCGGDGPDLSTPAASETLVSPSELAAAQPPASIGNDESTNGLSPAAIGVLQLPASICTDELTNACNVGVVGGSPQVVSVVQVSGQDVVNFYDDGQVVYVEPEVDWVEKMFHDQTNLDQANLVDMHNTMVDPSTPNLGVIKELVDSLVLPKQGENEQEENEKDSTDGRNKEESDGNESATPSSDEDDDEDDGGATAAAGINSVVDANDGDDDESGEDGVGVVSDDDEVEDECVNDELDVTTSEDDEDKACARQQMVFKTESTITSFCKKDASKLPKKNKIPSNYQHKHLSRSGAPMDAPILCENRARNRGEDGPFYNFEEVNNHLQEQSEPLLNITSGLIENKLQDFDRTMDKVCIQVVKLESALEAKTESLKKGVDSRKGVTRMIEIDVEKRELMQERLHREFNNDVKNLQDARKKIIALQRNVLDQFAATECLSCPVHCFAASVRKVQGTPGRPRKIKKRKHEEEEEEEEEEGNDKNAEMKKKNNDKNAEMKKKSKESVEEDNRNNAAKKKNVVKKDKKDNEDKHKKDNSDKKDNNDKKNKKDKKDNSDKKDRKDKKSSANKKDKK